MIRRGVPIPNNENAGSSLTQDVRSCREYRFRERKESDGNVFFYGQMALMADPRD